MNNKVLAIANISLTILLGFLLNKNANEGIMGGVVGVLCVTTSMLYLNILFPNFFKN